MGKTVVVFALAVLALPTATFGGGNARTNPPSECKAADSACGCPSDKDVEDDCIKVSLDMGASTPWTGSARCTLRVFADDQSPMVFTPESLFAVMGYTFKRIGRQRRIRHLLQKANQKLLPEESPSGILDMAEPLKIIASAFPLMIISYLRQTNGSRCVNLQLWLLIGDVLEGDQIRRCK